MNLTPYPNLLLRMPPPLHVAHTTEKTVGMCDSRVSVYRENNSVGGRSWPSEFSSYGLRCLPVVKQQWWSIN